MANGKFVTHHGKELVLGTYKLAHIINTENSGPDGTKVYPAILEGEPDVYTYTLGEYNAHNVTVVVVAGP